MVFCPKCHRTLTTDNFSKDKNRDNGLQYWCRSCINFALKKRRLQLNNILFSHYGYKCNCCHKTLQREFLTIDHINNDGAQQRRERKARSIYDVIGRRNIRRGEFPDDLQTLCWNCNAAKGFYGTCPHQKSKNLPKKFMALFKRGYLFFYSWIFYI